MNVDPRVYALAEMFLNGASETDKQDLAEEIQQTIDGFIEALEEFEQSKRAVNDIPSPL